jgi:FkbM family methyltransferase
MSRNQVEEYGKTGATGEPLAKILDEFYLYVEPDEQSVGRWLSGEGYWESWITSWMSKNIKPGARCVDVGANWGYYTRLMEVLAGKNGHVYSFEPNPNLFDKLGLSMMNHHTKDGAVVECYNLAISDKEGSVVLQVPTTMSGGATIMHGDTLPSTINKDLWDDSYMVDTDTLDNIVEGHIDLIKMDIEGAEPLAWRGMQETLKNTDVVILEVGSYSPSEFIDELYENYNVTVVNGQGEEVQINRKAFYDLEDLVMAVLRRK